MLSSKTFSVIVYGLMSGIFVSVFDFTATVPGTSVGALSPSRVKYSLNGVSSNGVTSSADIVTAGLDFSICNWLFHGSTLIRPPSGSAAIAPAPPR